MAEFQHRLKNAVEPAERLAINESAEVDMVRG